MLQHDRVLLKLPSNIMLGEITTIQMLRISIIGERKKQGFACVHALHLFLVNCNTSGAD